MAMEKLQEEPSQEHLVGIKSMYIINNGRGNLNNNSGYVFSGTSAPLLIPYVNTNAEVCQGEVFRRVLKCKCCVLLTLIGSLFVSGSGLCRRDLYASCCL